MDDYLGFIVVTAILFGLLIFEAFRRTRLTEEERRAEDEEFEQW